MSPRVEGALGVGIGVPTALLTMRMAGAVLFGVSATDLPTLLAAAALMFVIAAAASCLPARRATMVSPIIALRLD